MPNMQLGAICKILQYFEASFVAEHLEELNKILECLRVESDASTTRQQIGLEPWALQKSWETLASS